MALVSTAPGHIQLYQINCPTPANNSVLVGICDTLTKSQMEPEVRNNELQLIHKEYTPFFESIDLKLANNLLASLNDGIYGNKTSHLRVQTGEGDIKRITVDLNGWSIIGNPKAYETFEMLMMDTSPSFRDLFGNKLAQKLHQLDQASSDSDN